MDTAHSVPKTCMMMAKVGYNMNMLFPQNWYLVYFALSRGVYMLNKLVTDFSVVISTFGLGFNLCLEGCDPWQCCLSLCAAL